MNLPTSASGQRRVGPTEIAADSPLQTASRLISETAHDLNTPLEAIRQSARLVNDGYLGPTSAEQRACLSNIAECCDQMTALIEDMLSLEQLRSGIPRVRRRWFDFETVEQSITRTLQTALQSRNVTLVWDRPDGLPLVYGDPGKLGRLLLNLVANALVSIPEHAQILIRIQPDNDRSVLRVSIIDHGGKLGMSADEGTGDVAMPSGLGLAISRQLAALHFSPLNVASRAGEGSRVDFELPAAGPTSVADAWLRWRQSWLAKRRRPIRRSENLRGLDADGAGQTLHLDDRSPIVRPTVKLPPQALAPQHDCRAPAQLETATAIGLRLGSTVSVETADGLDERLQDQMRLHELAYRADARRWVLLLDANASEANLRIESLETRLLSDQPTARLQWSTPTPLPLEERHTRGTLCDVMIRDALSSHDMLPLGEDRHRGGSGPMPAISEVASRRLEAELRRLSGRVSAQRDRLIAQADAIRSPS